MTEMMFALSRHPSGVQITLYPNRATLDIGWGGHTRYEGKTLAEVVVAAVKDVVWDKSPPEVFASIPKGGGPYPLAEALAIIQREGKLE